MKHFILFILFNMPIFWCNSQTISEIEESERYIDLAKEEGGKPPYNYLNAIEYLNKAIELNPLSSKAFFYRGHFKSLNSDFYHAIEDFDESIKLNPKEGIAFFYRGLAQFSIYTEDVSFWPDSLYLDYACDDFNEAYSLGYVDAYDYISKYCK